MFHPAAIPLIALATVAAVIDWRMRRIPNWLNLVIAIAGLGLALEGRLGVTFGMSILGLLTGFVLLFPAFALGAMGGGDVKMLAAVGAWTGPVGAVIVLLAATVVGGIIAVTQAIYAGKFTALIQNSGLLMLNFAHVRTVGTDHIAHTGKRFRSIDRPLPYAVALLGGVIIWCIWF